MPRPIKVGKDGLWRVAQTVATIGLAVALLTGCAFSGRIVAPTAQPPRLLDPTRPAATGAPLQPTAAGTAGPAATPAPAERTLRIIGVVEAIEGEIWIVDGQPIRVPATIVLAPGLGVGSLVRTVVRLGDDDDDGRAVAVLVEPVREVALVGQVGALDGASITIDGRVIGIPAGVVVPAGLAPGAIVRVVVDDDRGALVLRLVEPLVEARVIGGTVELIDGDLVIIGGQRLRLAPDVVLWRVRLVVGEPVRIIVLPVSGVLTIVTITTVTVIIPPPVVVVPVPPTATAVYVPPPPPQPAPRPAPPANRDDDDDDD